MTDASTQTAQAAAGEGNLLLGFLTLLGEQKRVFLVVVLLGVALSLTMALRAPRIYSASTIILPPQAQQNSAAGTLAQLGALAGMAGVGAAKAPDEMYVSLLKTRRLQDAVIQRFGLQKRYGKTTMLDTRALLAKRVAVSTERKTGLITVTVDDLDAAFAAEVANGYFDELKKLLSTLAVTEAQQRRMFYEQQVSKGRETLAEAEMNFRKVQAESGMSASQSLAEAGIKAGVDLRTQIAGKEVQLAAVSRFATGLSPERQKLAAELAALRQQLIKLEQGGGASASTPNQGMAAVQAFRNMKIQEASLDALIRLYEVARVDEAREGPLLQQVDKAVPPERFAKPSRAGIAIRGGLLSVVVGVVLAVSLAWWRRCKRQPASPAWQRLKSAWL